MKNNIASLLRSKPYLHAALAFIASLTIISFQIYNQKLLLPHSDALLYLSIAMDIHDKGIFTNGTFQNIAMNGPNGEGMFFSPLYPYFLSAIMRLDPGLYEMANCLIDNSGAQTCEPQLNGLLFAQGLIASFSLFLIWLSAYTIIKRAHVAWFALFLASLAEAYAYYAGQALNENMVFPLFTLSCLLFVIGMQSGKWQNLIIAGIALGLTALLRPSFTYIVYGVIFIALSHAAYSFIFKRRNFKLPLLLLIFTAGYYLAVSPWILRNGEVFNKYAISEGYAPFIFVQRVAYNEMTAKEFAVSFIYGLPDFGDSLAAKLFNEHDYKRFRYGEPTGFYSQGNGAFKITAIEKAGGNDKLMGHLIQKSLIESPLKHIYVTLSLVWSGMWVSKYWGLIAIPIFMTVMCIKCFKHRDYSFLLYSLPAWFMLGFNAFTSVNVVRYNLIMIPCLAIGTAIGLIWLYNYLSKDRLCDSKEEPNHANV